MDKVKELPRQQQFELEKPRTLGLIESAQKQGILQETETREIPLGLTERITIKDFFFGRDMLGLRLKGYWNGEQAVSLVPIGLKVEYEQVDKKSEWQLLFVPLFRNGNDISIPNPHGGMKIKSIDVALPKSEWPYEQTSEIGDLIADSRRKIIYPHTGQGKVRDYEEVYDPWNLYLKNRGSKLPKEVKELIESTPSENQIKYLKQFRNT